MTRLIARTTIVPAAAVLVGGAALLTGCTGSGHSAATGSGGPSSGQAATATPSGPASGRPTSGQPVSGHGRATSGGSGSTSGASSSTPSGSVVSGNIHQTVPARTIHTQAPVAPRRAASFGGQVSVTASAITPITTVARGPGEISGPGLSITLVFHNGSSRAIDLDNTVVTLFDDTQAPADEIDGPPARHVSGQLAAHRSSTGRYVFTIAKSRRTPITIDVSYAPTAPVVQIVGNAD